jgi:NADH-quinone oxidoreductase subunit N
VVSIETIQLLLPELILILLATAVYVGGAFTPARDGWGWMASAGILLAAGALYQQQLALDGSLVSGPIVIDFFTQAIRWGVLGTGLILIMTSAKYASDDLAAEFMGSLLLVLAGLMLAAASADLILIFAGLELVSIPTYVILYVGRSDSGSQEAATKYFFLSVLSSAIFLYGLSFLYGVAGSTHLETIYAQLAVPETGQFLMLARLALVLIFAGLGFRLTMVPFHFYAPDVYQGTSHPNAGLLAVVPKIAAVAVLVRLVFGVMPNMDVIGWQMSLALAVLTMTVGNVMALWQQNIRRLMAYSSIAHAGYMLIGIAVAFAKTGPDATSSQLDGVGATLFYLLVYAVATAGTFAALAYLSGSDRQVNTIDDLAGVSQTSPKTALAIAIFMFSLTGLPPLAGFWGKLMLFTGALSLQWDWFVGLAVIGVLNAAISAGYYLRVVGAMYFRPPLSTPRAEGGPGAALATLICALAVVAMGIKSDWLIGQSNRASRAAAVSLRTTSAPPASAVGSSGKPGAALAEAR